jgi:hypothetical protein
VLASSEKIRLRRRRGIESDRSDHAGIEIDNDDWSELNVPCDDLNQAIVEFHAEHQRLKWLR